MQRRWPPAGAAQGGSQVSPSLLACQRFASAAYGTGSKPVAQGRTVQRHTLAGEDLCLAIQRQMVAVFVDQHMGQQCLGRHAGVDWPLGSRPLHHGFCAGPATIPWPAGHPDPEVGRNVIQHLAAVFADQMQRATTARAGLVIDIDHLLDARQFRRQRATIAFGWFGGWRMRRCVHNWRARSRHRHRGALLGHRLLQALDPLLHRRVVELLRAPAEAVALQRRDDQPLPLDLGRRCQQHVRQGRRAVWLAR